MEYKYSLHSGYHPLWVTCLGLINVLHKPSPPMHKSPSQMSGREAELGKWDKFLNLRWCWDLSPICNNTLWFLLLWLVWSLHRWFSGGYLLGCSDAKQLDHWSWKLCLTAFSMSRSIAILLWSNKHDRAQRVESFLIRCSHDDYFPDIQKRKINLCVVCLQALLKGFI